MYIKEVILLKMLELRVIMLAALCISLSKCKAVTAGECASGRTRNSLHADARCRQL